MNTILIENLANFHQEVREELEHILTYWLEYSVDVENGGFYGEIGPSNEVNPRAVKSLVLNSRILWTFSAAYDLLKVPAYKTMAERAYAYLSEYFIDPEKGGCYWTLDFRGQPKNCRKQIYGQAFAIYSLTEYYKISQKPDVRRQAIDLFHHIEKFGLDPDKGGYIEALGKDWEALEDVRLSARDANEKKTMNTHLHILEAYTNLYRIWPDQYLKVQIQGLFKLYQNHLVNTQDYYQHLYLDEDWVVKSNLISYGHDIEASWLIWEAHELLGDEKWDAQLRPLILGLAYAALKGVDQDGGMNYELDLANQTLHGTKYAWVQAEAVVGFFNAYQVSQNPMFLEASLKSWEFIRKFIKDLRYGEWHWGVRPDHQPLDHIKVGFWKCPYHNSRACMEIIRRIEGKWPLEGAG